MGRRYSFLVFLLALLLMLFHASQPEAVIGVSEVREEMARGSLGGGNLDRRQELVEFLDRTIRFHRYRKTVVGEFSAQVEVGAYRIPAEISGNYHLEVVESNRTHFRIRVGSLPETHFLEQVTIDQDYRIYANFTVPAPRAEYLKLHASRHLQVLLQAPAGQFPEDEGLYAGYFEYRTERLGSGLLRVAATGIKRPVEGVRVESDAIAGFGVSSPAAVAGVEETEALREHARLGQKGAWMGGNGVLDPSGVMTEAIRTQLGHYAKDIQNLSSIAAMASDSNEPSNAIRRAPAAVPQKQSTAPPGRAKLPKSAENGLIIEAITD